MLTVWFIALGFARALLSFLATALEIGNNVGMVENAPTTARARVRAEMTGEILTAARRQLTEVGAAALSMRAITRELGMASSAIYRYFPSREALITQLIIDAYNSLGEAAERAEQAVDRENLRLRFKTVGHAVRGWALRNPHEYMLIYGTPIPGYEAPEATIIPATRVSTLLLTVGIEAAIDPAQTRSGSIPMPDSVRADLEETSARLGIGLPAPTLMLGLMSWSLIIGTISHEMFGHFNNVVDEGAAYFDHVLTLTAAQLGI
ncbi:putative HTH-type transcriptional regulator/MT1864 [bacterium BMS3Bbin02]|nr:putative HTH-type transcriptional regulator/MT1864 [bacterium BMS3Bbin02]